MRRPGSAQTVHVALEDVRDGVAHARGGPACAVLEVRQVNVALRGEAEREAVHAAYAAALNALPGPVQILVRVVPVDLEPAVCELEGRALGLPEGMATIARDHASLLRRLARGEALLARRAYLIVPAGLPRRAGWRAPSARPAAATRAAEDRQLAARCAELADQLGRCGIAARRLGDAELAELFYACWCPELGRVQRLRRDLAAYRALVVRKARDATERRGA